MEFNAATAATLSTLTEALDEADTALGQTLRQLIAHVDAAVDSYCGLTTIASIGESHVTITAMQELAETSTVLSSLRIPLGEAHTTPHRSTGHDIELILYATNRGAFVDLAADLSWLTHRDLSEFVLDAHLVPLPTGQELRRTSWINQAIGLLVGRGYTPELAAREIGKLATQTEQDRAWSAKHSLPGLVSPDPQPI